MTCDASLRGEANANALRTKQLAHRIELLDVIADRFDDHQDRNAQQKAGDSPYPPEGQYGHKYDQCTHAAGAAHPPRQEAPWANRHRRCWLRARRRTQDGRKRICAGPTRRALVMSDEAISKPRPDAP